MLEKKSKSQKRPPNLIKRNLHKKSIGHFGEDIAVKFLLTKKYKILDRNYFVHYGELDIVALEGETLVFIEVKTRIGNVYGTPEEAVTPRKLREVIKTGSFYAKVHPELPKRLRIDVIGIELNHDWSIKNLNHITNVTG